MYGLRGEGVAYFIAFGSAGLICVLTVLLSRAYVRRAFNSIDLVLDNVLNKKKIEPKLKLADSRISKLNHKAYRVLAMYVTDAVNAENEKETVQGFISDMSHQMKTPLSGISMYSELLFNGNLSENESREFSYRIMGLSEKLQWMMDCLIKMSRLEVGAIELSPKMNPIRKTIGKAIESVVSAAAKKDINICVSNFKDIELYHDRKWTAEVIANVLENAVKYSPNDSEITISVEPLTLYTKVIVTDYGIGIDESEYNLIFKRFYRSQKTRESEGAGLGLYLATLIMEKQGGYIMVDSRVGEFTSFSIFLQNCKK